jgi:uncharacterized protein
MSAATTRSGSQDLGMATLGVMPLLTATLVNAQDMSNGANNFYTSDKVNLQKVTFKDQYQMNVAGNLFTEGA